MKIVEVKNLTKNYGKNRGITDVSFDIEKGEIFGFIGPNGAGKSTTIRTLLNYIYPSSGEGKIFGMDIIKNSREIRNKTGYLPAEVNFTENIRAIELLKYSQEFYKKDCSERIYELSSKLNLDLKKKLDNFSLGNRKKVGIVQAIMHSPEFLILDEPTAGLDPLIQKSFFDLLIEERKKGTTILFSSHVLSEVQKYCDRVAIIKEGRLLKITAVDALTASSYKNVSIVTSSGEHQDYIFEGDLNQLISKIHEIKIRDIKIEEPSLEEIFLKYYEKEVI